jgi:hypothetical protein
VVVESTARTVAVHGVVHRPFCPPQPALELGVAWPHGRMSTAVRSFLMVVAELTAPLDSAHHPLRFPPYLHQRQPALAGNGRGTG